MPPPWQSSGAADQAGEQHVAPHKSVAGAGLRQGEGGAGGPQE